MDPIFWHQRWQDGRIGFHLQEVNPTLTTWWPRLGVAEGARVLVPLCGKSLDLSWLASQGLKVCGVELSGIACAAIFEQTGADPALDDVGEHVRWSAANLEVYQGDFFQFTAPPFDAAWDRAATIALPPRLRAIYAAHLARLIRPGGVVLMVTLDYPQTEQDGPPFSVPADEVRALHEAAFDVELLLTEDGSDERPDWKLSRLHVQTWKLTRRAS